MRRRPVLMTGVLFYILFAVAHAEDRSSLQYSGRVFSFSYPNTWRVGAQVDRDVRVGDSLQPISVEFAVSPGEAGDPHKMTLNAQKHVMGFASANNFIVKFESVNAVPPGGIRVISHLCSVESGNLHFCQPNDPKAIDVSTIIQEIKQEGGSQVLLVEVMHKPGIDEREISLARQIVQTLRVAH